MPSCSIEYLLTLVAPRKAHRVTWSRLKFNSRKEQFMCEQQIVVEYECSEMILSKMSLANKFIISFCHFCTL